MKKLFEITLIALIMLFTQVCSASSGLIPVVNYKINSKGEKENFSREEIVDRLQNGTGINMDHEEYLSSIANSVGAQGKDTWLPYIPESETGMMDKILSHSYLETTEFSPSTMAVSGVNTEKHLSPFPGGRSNYPGEQLLVCDMKDVYPEYLSDFNGNTKVYLVSAICLNPVFPLGIAATPSNQDDISRLGVTSTTTKSSSGDGSGATATATVTVVNPSPMVYQNQDVYQPQGGGYTTGYAPYRTSCSDYGYNTGFGFYATVGFGGGANCCPSSYGGSPNYYAPSNYNYNYNYYSDSHDNNSTTYTDNSYYNNEEYWLWYWDHHETVNNNYGDTTHHTGGGPVGPPNGDGGGVPVDPSNDRPTSTGGYTTGSGGATIGSTNENNPSSSNGKRPIKNVVSQTTGGDVLASLDSKRPVSVTPKQNLADVRGNTNNPKNLSHAAVINRPNQGNVRPVVSDVRGNTQSKPSNWFSLVANNRPNQSGVRPGSNSVVSSQPLVRGNTNSGAKVNTSQPQQPSREYAQNRPVQQNSGPRKVVQNTQQFSQERAQPQRVQRAPQKNYSAPAPQQHQLRNVAPRNFSPAPSRPMSNQRQSVGGRRK